MKKIKNDLTFALSLAAFSVFNLQGGSAALAADEAGAEFEEIIVTGNKRVKSLQDTQISVAVLRGEDLAQEIVIDFEEALLRVGNANISISGNLSLRGIRKQGPTGGISTNRTVFGYYIDGVALSSQAQRFAQSSWDIEQIEVLRGPVTTVQGRNALAGGLIVTTGVPEHEWSGKARASYGEENTIQLAAAITGPLIQDVLAIRLSVDHNSSDGTVTNTSRNEDDYASSESTTVRAKIQFTPESLPEFSATAAFSHLTMERGLGSYIGPNFSDRISIAGAPNISESDGIDFYSLSLNYDLSKEWSLKSVTAYQDSRVLNSSAFIETDPNNPQRTAFGDFEDTLFSQELLLAYTSDKLEALVGLYYADVENNQVRGSTIDAGLVNPALLGLDAVSASPLFEKITNYAGFLDVSYHVTDWLELTGGLRLDHETNSFARSSNGLAVPAFGLQLFPSTPTSTTNRSNGTKFLPRVGVVASLSETASLGFTFSQGYRPGGSGVNLVEVVRTGQPEFFEYETENTNNYEISFRSQWFDKSLTLNANAYLIDWNNQQVNILGPLGSAFDDEVISNAASSTVKGLEVEITKNVGNLSLFTSFAFSDASFDDFFVNGRDFSGNEFSVSASFTGSAGFSYAADNGLFVSGNVNHIGSSFLDNANTRELDGYTIVNASASYNWDNIRLFVYAKNLFDAEATTGIFFEGGGPLAVLGLNEVIELRNSRAPRRVGVGVEVRF
ncbi:MAG: TonB-dependent receptor [Kordiimonadaceae bacterium]|nr:TonB-dependent receptor [Kordiimonadaceae bacterium]